MVHDTFEVLKTCFRLADDTDDDSTLFTVSNLSPETKAQFKQQIADCLITEDDDIYSINVILFHSHIIYRCYLC